MDAERVFTGGNVATLKLFIDSSAGFVNEVIAFLERYPTDVLHA